MYAWGEMKDKQIQDMIHQAEQKLFKEVRKNPLFADWTDAELRAFMRQHKDEIFKEERSKRETETP